MKLSQAIEDALRTRKYNPYNEFMCPVLDHNYSPELKLQLREHLNKVFSGIRDEPLVNELWKLAGGIHMSNEASEVFWENSFKRTTEWYVWFVFDLKRKGL